MRVPVVDEARYATGKIGQSKSRNPKPGEKFWFFGGKQVVWLLLSTQSPLLNLFYNLRQDSSVL
jgi:hypothetical protein